jgi:hypothetical protein
MFDSSSNLSERVDFEVKACHFYFPQFHVHTNTIAQEIIPTTGG